jgi:hypothetical protein
VDVGTADANAINAKQNIVSGFNPGAGKIFQSPVARSVKNYCLHRIAHVFDSLRSSSVLVF